MVTSGPRVRFEHEVELGMEGSLAAVAARGSSLSIRKTDGSDETSPQT